MDNERTDSAKENAEAVRVVYQYPDPVSISFANHMSIVKTEHEVILGFYQISLPISSTDENLKEYVKNNGGIFAQTIARVAIPSTRFKEFLELLNSQIGE